MKVDWLQRARQEGTPLLDGEMVTFFWHGEQAPLLIGDFTDWESAPVQMEKAGPQTWIYRLRLPPDAYMEYAFLQGDQRLTDPFNRRRTPNGVGKYNHYFYMPQARPKRFGGRKAGDRLARGIVSHHRLSGEGLIVGKQRLVHLYHPAAPGPYPLLVVWDGREYLHRARLPQMLDVLIAQGRVRPLALAMVENGGPARLLEYLCSEATLGFLRRQVLPLANSQLDLVDIQQQPGAFGVLGASMGGLMSLYTGLRLPHLFGRVLAQSGAFQLPGSGDMLVMDLIRQLEPLPLKIWLNVGLFDFPVILEANRRLRDLLAQRGYEFSYREYPAGHNYPAWRDELWQGLEFHFAE